MFLLSTHTSPRKTLWALVDVQRTKITLKAIFLFRKPNTWFTACCADVNQKGVP